MNTDILKIKGTWDEVLDDCRATVNKEALRKEPSAKFKRDILIAEHSPIRDLIIKWKWTEMPSWVATHFVRHKWECYVRTQRTDRTGIDRNKLPQDNPVEFTGEANVQHLIDTMRKRLCFQASNETRKAAADLVRKIEKYEPEVANVLVPNCIYRCGCPEIGGGCGWFNHAAANEPRFRSIDISERYKVYHDTFFDREDW